jgi:hypothetical protein
LLERSKTLSVVDFKNECRKFFKEKFVEPKSKLSASNTGTGAGVGAGAGAPAGSGVVEKTVSNKVPLDDRKGSKRKEKTDKKSEWIFDDTLLEQCIYYGVICVFRKQADGF